MSTILKALERVEEERRVHHAGGPPPAVAEPDAPAPSTSSLASGSIAQAGEPFDPKGLRERGSWSPLWIVGLGVGLTLAVSWYTFRDDAAETGPAIATAEAPGSVALAGGPAADSETSSGGAATVGPLAAAPPLAEIPPSFRTEVERSPLDPPRPARDRVASPGAAESASLTRPAGGLPRPQPAPGPTAEVAGAPTHEAPPVVATAQTSTPPAEQAALPAAARAALLAARAGGPPNSESTPLAPSPTPQGTATAPPLPRVASQPPSEVIPPAPAPPEPLAKELTPPKPKPKVRVVSVPPAPKVTVEQTVWHPKPERRSARVVVAGINGPLELKEGDAVGVLVVAEIKPSSVVFLHGASRIKRRVGR